MRKEKAMKKPDHLTQEQWHAMNIRPSRSTIEGWEEAKVRARKRLEEAKTPEEKAKAQKEWDSIKHARYL